MSPFLLEIWLAVAFTAVAANQGTSLKGDRGHLHQVYWETYRECGGVVPLSALHVSVIQYKWPAEYDLNEFCVWSFLPQENVESVMFSDRQNSVNMSDPNDGLVAYFWEGPNLTSRELPRAGFGDITFEAPPAFLTFNSDVNPSLDSNGFELHIEPKPFPQGLPAANKYKAYHFNKEEGEFTYPEKGKGRVEYDNGERVSVVVQGSKTKDMVLKEVDIEPDYDSISVYTFLPYEAADRGTGLIGRFSGKHAEVLRSSTTSRFPNVYLFTSDYKGTGKGFTVQWKTFTQES